MITTPELISSLVASATPVRRLRPPLVRATLWLSVALLVLAVLAVAHGVRPDFAQRMRQPVFVIAVIASLGTGILAAVASFTVAVPGRSRRWLWAPLPPLLIWLSTIGYGCLTNWVSIGPAGVALGETARCFATLVLVSLPLSLALFVMLRHVALLRPTAVAVTGSLAVAGITATALSLFHPLDASAMVLVWNVGVTLVIVMLGAVAGMKARDLRPH